MRSPCSSRSLGLAGSCKSNMHSRRAVWSKAPGLQRILLGWRGSGRRRQTSCTGCSRGRSRAEGTAQSERARCKVKCHLRRGLSLPNRCPERDHYFQRNFRPSEKQRAYDRSHRAKEEQKADEALLEDGFEALDYFLLGRL